MPTDPYQKTMKMCFYCVRNGNGCPPEGAMEFEMNHTCGLFLLRNTPAGLDYLRERRNAKNKVLSSH